MSSFGIHPISQSWGFPLEPSRQARYLYNPQSVIKHGGPLGNPQNNRHVIIMCVYYIYTSIYIYIYCVYIYIYTSIYIYISIYIITSMYIYIYI